MILLCDLPRCLLEGVPPSNILLIFLSATLTVPILKEVVHLVLRHILEEGHLTPGSPVAVESSVFAVRSTGLLSDVNELGLVVEFFPLLRSEFTELGVRCNPLDRKIFNLLRVHAKLYHS